MKQLGLILLVVFGSVGSAQSECEEGLRLFDHEFLEGDAVCLPENPQRIVALDLGAAEATLFAGKTLVGAAPWVVGEMPVMLPELTDAFQDVMSLGYPASLEQVLLLEPDLILTTSDAIDVAAASEIAPVVVGGEGSYRDWENGASLWGAALGTPELYGELKASYEARIAELQEALGEARRETEVSVISVSSGATWLWLVDTAIGGVLTDVGLSRPESQNLSGAAATERYADAPFVTISNERLDLADGDVIFAFNYATADPETLTEENAVVAAFKQNPLWQGLNGVSAGRAYFVGGHWWRAQTYLLVNEVIDDLFEHLVGEPGTVPALSFEEIAR